MRISFFVDSFPSLSETFITNQVITLLDRGHNVEILAFEQSDDWGVHEEISQYNLSDRATYIPPPETYVEGASALATALPSLLGENVRLTDLCNILSNGTRSPRQLTVLDSLIRRDQPDVYHAHFGPIGEALRPTAEVLGVPLVVSFYGHDVSRAVQEEGKRYEQLFEASSELLALSEEMRERLHKLGAPESKTRVQPLMVDVDSYPFRERRSTEGPTQIITIARLVEKKGVEYAIEAVNRIDNHDVEFKIVGDGPCRDRLEQKIRELDVEETVQILGYVNHDRAKELLYESDLFLLPSITASDGDKEGTPTILLEAQATGLPVVSTRHAGIPEIVDDGNTGLLVPERDVEALTTALQRLIESPEKWAEMGRAGRELVRERHSPDKLAEKLESVYAEARR